MTPHCILPRATVICLGVMPVAALAVDTSVVPDLYHAGRVRCGPIVTGTLAHVTDVKSLAVNPPNGTAKVVAAVSDHSAASGVATRIKALTQRICAVSLTS